MVKTTRAKNRLYKVLLKLETVECLQASSCEKCTICHTRLGHINKETMRSMVKNDLVTGIPEVGGSTETCVSCLKGKQTRKPFPQASSYRAIVPLELVHADLCGPISPQTLAHKRYIFVLVDDCLRYMWMILVKEKTEAFEKFKHFKMQVEQEIRAGIRTLRTDRGGEFLSHEFQSYCDKYGITRHLTAPYSSQQNGVVERRNRTLLEMTRSILKHMSMQNYLLGETIRHATYVINRVATRSLTVKTPYEALRGRKPNLSHLKVFGCACYARTEKVGRKKLDDILSVLVPLGTEPRSKSYRLLDPSTRRIVVSRDVVFEEFKEWSWTKANDNNEDNEFVISQDRLKNVLSDGDDSGITNENEDMVEHDDEDDEDSDGNEEESQPQHRRSATVSMKPSYLNDYVLLAEVEGERLLMMINNELWSFNEAKEIEVWIDACKDAIFSIEKNNTWDLVELLTRVKPIWLKWVFKINRNADGTINKYKARLVAKGYVQRHGVEYDEVFALVARIETIRLIIALAGSYGWEIHHLDVRPHSFTKS